MLSVDELIYTASLTEKFVRNDIVRLRKPNINRLICHVDLIVYFYANVIDRISEIRHKTWLHYDMRVLCSSENNILISAVLLYLHDICCKWPELRNYKKSGRITIITHYNLIRHSVCQLMYLIWLSQPKRVWSVAVSCVSTEVVRKFFVLGYVPKLAQRSFCGRFPNFLVIIDIETTCRLNGEN